MNPIELVASPRQQPGATRPNPFQTRFLARVPASIAASFTAEQLAAVQLAFGMRHTPSHAMDCRRTLSLPWGRYYLVLLVGRDWRREGGQPGLATAGRLLLDTLGCGIATAGLILSAWRLTQIVVALAV